MLLIYKREPAAGAAAITEAVADLLRRRDDLALQPPWSIAELGLDDGDFLKLSSWGSGLDAQTVRRWLCDTWTLADLPSGARHPHRACLGLMLLAYAAEAARRRATDGTLWPHVRSDDSGARRFRDDVDFELFHPGGHPTDAYKRAIGAAARTFGLRNVLGELDTQRYYVTVVLQFGFTIRDARLRIGQWLSGGTTQVAIEYLLDAGGPQHSPAFAGMWDDLKRNRADDLPPEELARRLAHNPWVLPGWAGELVGLSARRVAAGTVAAEATGCGFGAILGKPELRWSPPGPPRFICRLENLDMAGLVAPEYELRSGGRRLARIIRGEDGSYEATPAEIVLPAFAPAMAAELAERGGGEVTATLTPTCFAQDEWAAAFELPSGRRIETGERLRPTRDHALIFSPDLMLDPPGASWSAAASGRFRVETLAARDIASSRLRLGDETVWTPTAASAARRPAPEWAHVDVGVDTTSRGLLSLGATYRLTIRHGGDVEVVFARCRMDPVSVVAEAPGRTLAGPIALPADASSGLLEWTLGLRRGSETARVRCVPRLVPVGAAILQGHDWSVLGPDFRMSVDEAQAAAVRVFPPEIWDNRRVARDEWSVMEGDTWIDRLGVRPRAVRNLTGLGARLTVRRGPFNAVPDIPHKGKVPTIDALVLAGEVVDRGRLRGLQLEPDPGGDAGRTTARLDFEGPLEIDGRHQVVWWDRGGLVHRLRPRAWVEGSDRREDRWVVDLPAMATTPRAVGVDYGGHRLGAWWASDWHVGLEAPGDEDPTGVAVLLRWLRLPILSRSARGAIRRFVRASPSAVLSAWVADADAPAPYRWALGGDGWRAALREAFLEWEPTPVQAAGIVSEWAERGGDPIPGVAPALALLDVCPLLMGRFLHAWLAAARADGIPRSDIRAVLAQIRHEVVRNARVGEFPGVSPSRPRERPGCRSGETLRRQLLGRSCEGFSTSKAGHDVDPRFVEALIEAGVASLGPARSGPKTGPVGFDQRSNIAVAIAGLEAFRDLLALGVLDALDALDATPADRRPRT